MKVAIVMVNYRTPDLVLDCLRSIAIEQGDDLQILVLIGDAESGDGSVAKISEFIEVQGYDWAQCFSIGRNGGFAYGNNFILEHYVLVDPEVAYVHFLNPDTYIRPGAVRKLVRFLATTPSAGAAGSLLENPDGSQRACAFRFPAPWREFFRGASFSLFYRLVPASKTVIANLRSSERVDWVSGASFMMPRAALEHVGLMDDKFFLYFEETDLMARLKAAGYEVWHVPESRVVHLAGQATGYRAGGRPLRLSPHWLRSRSYFMTLHYGRVGLVRATILFLLGDLAYRLRCLLLLRRLGTPPKLWRDYFRFGFSDTGRKPHEVSNGSR